MPSESESKKDKRGERNIRKKERKHTYLGCWTLPSESESHDSLVAPTWAELAPADGPRSCRCGLLGLARRKNKNMEERRERGGGSARGCCPTGRQGRFSQLARPTRGGRPLKSVIVRNNRTAWKYFVPEFTPKYYQVYLPYEQLCALKVQN